MQLLTLLHLAWPWYALSQSRTCTHLFLLSHMYRGSCGAVQHPCICAAILVGVASPHVMQPFASLAVLTRTARGSPGFHSSGDTEHDTEPMLWAVQLQLFWDTWGQSFRVVSSWILLGSLSSFLEVCPWNSGLHGCREKPENTQSYSILSVTHDFLSWRAHTIASFWLPFVSLHAAAPADVQGGVPALIHPKSSFCVCKSQHPLAQVSLFPTGGCRGSAWWGYMCTSSCPFEQISLWTSHFSQEAQLFPCVPSTELFLK